MSLYLDTSALVPLFIGEPTTERCRTLWRSTPIVSASVLVEIELHTSLAQARRMGRLDDVGLAEAMDAARRRIPQMNLVSVSPPVVTAACLLAVRHGLRGYDATHLASALLLDQPDLVFASGDRALLRAAATEGLPTASTHG